MAFAVFHIPARGDAEASSELNGFLNSHRILSVKRRLIEQGDASYWTFCVDYLEGSSKRSSSTSKPAQRNRVDYRELLSPEDFAVSAQLRDLRKEVAAADGIPVYNVFNNDHLAKMVEGQMRSLSDLKKIDGLGEAKVEKYGERFLEALKAAQSSGAADSETSEPTV